jgi:release factor glutamine methyltransferase
MPVYDHKPKIYDMINLESDKFNEINTILLNCIESGNYTDWAVTLEKIENSYNDGFLNLMALPNFTQILNSLGFATLKDWFIRVNEWSTEICDPRKDSKPEALILHQLWNHLTASLTNSVRTARLIGSIPPKGGILCYFGGMTKCIIIKYDIISEYPKFQFIDMIDNPKSVFDFWSLINGSDLRQKNILKEILSTGHKLIYQRGVLIHVDRRKDIEVFGPTIDTILITEILSQQVFESNTTIIENALEIGCGNGLITVSIARNCQNIKLLQAIDIDFNSIICCQRNLRSNLPNFKYGSINKFLVYGQFKNSIVNTKFDLVVCNPPYIPFIDASFSKFHSKKDYFRAVGGLSLIDEIMEELSNILKPNGKLLLLVSSVSLDYTIGKIPKDYSHNLPLKDGFEVIFDVEAVLNNSKWLNFLIKSGGVSSSSGVYYHKLFPIWIQKKHEHE